MKSAKKEETPYLKIMEFSKEWVKLQFREFSSEDLKRAYFESGNPEVENTLVFGPVFRKLSADKLIFPHGTTNAKSKIANGRLMRTWISLEFKLRQKGNATKDKSLNLFTDGNN